MSGKRETAASATPPVKGPASYFPSIEQKYGRPIADWLTLINAQTGKKHMELVEWLKSTHQLGHGHANALVVHALSMQKKTPQQKTPLNKTTGEKK